MGKIEPLREGELETKVFRAPGPVALDFFQASCAPCRVLEPLLERVAAQYGDRLPIHRVDIDRDMSLAQRFGVRSIPTVIVFRAGNEIERLDGLIREVDLKAAFDRAVEGVGSGASAR
jgi:thioredoxin